MSIYDEYKQAILSRKEAEQKELTQIADEINTLVKGLTEALGAPPEALRLLNTGGGGAIPIDFKPDNQRSSSFLIELSVRNGEELLAQQQIRVSGAPALGSGRLITVNGKMVQGGCLGFNSQNVVDHITNEIKKAM
ncbi:hypothetical protein [Burkholderia sp. F1]|uniref:hypothetical protein n=1 Tax=Burkholderia sp. F1 TaxID=3366817 RepID=UPI003D743142